VHLESHPGPGIGASWAILPEAGIVFVGDLVLKNQPPFLAQARLPEWLESLKVLMTEYKNYTIVSGRGGVVPYATVQAQFDQLAKIHDDLESLAKRQSGPDAVESLVGPIITALKAPSHRQKQYAQRLAYGLRQCYARYYLSSDSPDFLDE
jgi:glyoxylase-like metal-dependent hydrolase (beta-lactamase superfamily II)